MTLRLVIMPLTIRDRWRRRRRAYGVHREHDPTALRTPKPQRAAPNDENEEETDADNPPTRPDPGPGGAGRLRGRGPVVSGIRIKHEYEFTTVRRSEDNWLLGTVHYSKAFKGYLVTMLWPVGTRLLDVYPDESAAVAAICRVQNGILALGTQPLMAAAMIARACSWIAARWSGPRKDSA
jgi:hypothetical protein